QLRERVDHVVLDELNLLLALEACPRGIEHHLRDIESDATETRAVALQHGKQPPVPGAEFEHPSDVGGNVLNQHAISLGSARELIGALQVATNVVSGAPFPSGH